MTIHYHGTPITPRETLQKLAGHCFCVSFSDPRDVEVCHKIGQSVMLDNGAYSIWRQDQKEKENWADYYGWVEPWLDYQTTWAVIPDTITGSEDDNYRLLKQWPFRHRGAPVWHMHEKLSRLKDLCYGFEKVCIGSSAEYATIGTYRWNSRMVEAFEAICRNGKTPCWLHMLRGMSLIGSSFPFASLDSTDVAQNWHCNGDAVARARRWDGYQCPGRWEGGPTQPSMYGAMFAEEKA